MVFFILILLMIGAYLIGSIPFAVITGYLLSKEDIRTKGSGNAGATNVFRVLGWKAGIFVMLADFSKAFFPVFFASRLLEWSVLENIPVDLLRIGLFTFVIIGHLFPLFAKFKGGKGVASAAGGISALFPPAILFCLIVFAGTTIISKYISLASLLTAWLLPLYYFIFTLITERVLSFSLLFFFVGLTLLITIFHRGNIKRLFRGEEKKIQFKRRS